MLEPAGGLQHLKHVVRVVLLLVVLIVTLVLGRFLFVPESWARYGWYRADNLAEQKAHPVRHGGDGSCAGCHEEKAKLHASGPHRTVRCELCHAPVVTHADEEDKTADMATRRDAGLCALCHRKLSARPADFPQVDLREHVEGWGQAYTSDVCFMCHNPHKLL